MTYDEARILEIQARLSACMVRLEGMKSANVLREQQRLAPAYGEEIFDQLAREIESYANEIRTWADRGGL